MPTPKRPFERVMGEVLQMTTDPAITVLVGDTAAESAQQQLFSKLYAELRRVAAREVRRYGAAVTLSPTTLLHETYLSLAPHVAASFNSKAQFVAYAARAMRGLVIDHMRRRHTKKRGGDCEITSLSTDLPIIDSPPLDTEKLASALDTLTALEPALAQCVDLKFFCGFSFGEIAEMRQVSERTVRRDWDKARVLLGCLIEARPSP